MGRPFGCNKPLRYGKPGITGQGDFAVTPWENSDLFDGIVVIFAVSFAPESDVAFRIHYSSGIDIDDGIASGNPFSGIRTIYIER